MLGDQFVLDHHRVVDRIVAALTHRRKPCLERIGDERLHVGGIHLNADCGGEFAGCQHVADTFSLLDRHHVGGRAILRHVLVP